MSVRLEACDADVLLPVRAHAKARRNAVTGEHDGRLKVSVTQAPEKGKANEAIRAALAGALGLRKAQLDLVAGEASSQKAFRVSGVTLADLQSRIARCLAAL